nr:hypothetical protein [Tanacetum cinerariifolium]
MQILNIFYFNAILESFLAGCSLVPSDFFVVVSKEYASRTNGLDSISAANKEEPVRRGPEAGSPGSTLRRSSQNSIDTEDGLPWPDNADMAFDLRQTEDVLPWPGNANMAFDLRQTEDGLPWLDNANME